MFGLGPATRIYVAVEAVDLRLQAVEVTGQDILTRDKVGLRLNLSATWRYVDVLKAFTQLAKPAEHLYRELQFGLRASSKRGQPAEDLWQQSSPSTT